MIKKIALSLVILLLSAFGARTLFASADSSLPGDKLFSLDQILEKMEVASANSQPAKARLEIAHVEERLREFEQLILGGKTTLGEGSLIKTVHAQEVSERDINYHNTRESLSLFQVYLIDAEAMVSQLKGTSEYEDLLSAMAKVLFLHQEIWESLADQVPSNLLDDVKQASSFMDKSLTRIIQALPAGKRLDLAKKLKDKIPNIESKINSAAAAKDVTTFTTTTTTTSVNKSESSGQTASPTPQQKSPNANIKTGSGSTSVDTDTGSGGNSGVEIPVGIDNGVKTCTGLQIFSVCVGE